MQYFCTAQTSNFQQKCVRLFCYFKNEVFKKFMLIFKQMLPCVVQS